jgi:hypothetical protein
MNKFEEISPYCVPEIMKVNLSIVRQINNEKYVFSLYHLNTRIDEVYTGFGSRSLYSCSPCFKTLMNLNDACKDSS